MSLLLTATVTVPATHTEFEDLEDLCYGVTYSLERETQAIFIETGYFGTHEVTELTVQFTWPGYLHEARAFFADYRVEGETDSGTYSVKLENIG